MKSDETTKNGPHHQGKKIEMAGTCVAHGRRQDTKAQDATRWQMDSCTRRAGRPRSNWIDTVSRDLKSIGMAWEDAEKAAVDREDWRGRVVQCVFDTG